jgi:pimeloyl-ACP methyl ester carboxylesterase
MTLNHRAAYDQFVGALPNGRGAVIPGAHHAIFLSHPDETERLIREFLLGPAAPAP